MINFPHTLPLPDLSKQDRAEEREVEGGEKAGEESLCNSNCTSTLQLIPKQLQEAPTDPVGQEKEQAKTRTGAHTPVYGWQMTSPCACSSSCSAIPGFTPPHTAAAPSKLRAMTEGRSSLFTSIPVATSSHTNCSLIQSHQNPKFCWTAKLPQLTWSNDHSRTSLRRAGQEQAWMMARLPLNPPHLARGK